MESQSRKRKNYPAYVVFKDKSLKQIATMKPKDKTELIRVEGIGKQKLEDYGKSILDIVNEWNLTC